VCQKDRKFHDLPGEDSGDCGLGFGVAILLPIGSFMTFLVRTVVIVDRDLGLRFYCRLVLAVLTFVQHCSNWQ